MRRGTLWKPRDDAKLRALYASGDLWRHPQFLPKRTPNAIAARAHALGIRLSEEARSEASKAGQAKRADRAPKPAVSQPARQRVQSPPTTPTVDVDALNAHWPWLLSPATTWRIGA